MKLFLAAAFLVFIFVLLWADYRWRKWMKVRKQDRSGERSRDVK
jgi:hypothetical protein